VAAVVQVPQLRVLVVQAAVALELLRPIMEPLELPILAAAVAAQEMQQAAVETAALAALAS